MSKMKATDKQAMEILKKLDELIDFSVDLETNLDESESIEEVLLCLEDTIDEFCSAVEVIEAIREFLIEVENLDEDESDEAGDEECTCCAPPELRNELIRIAQSIQAYERMAAEKRRSENTSKGKPMPEIPVPDEDSVRAVRQMIRIKTLKRTRIGRRVFSMRTQTTDPDPTI